MTNQTPYNQLNEIICEKRYHFSEFSPKYITFEREGLLSKEKTLQDVLLAMQENLGGEYLTRFQELDYDLTKPLANQSDETLLALIELIK